ncbi:Heterodimeric efflux ABC transporter, permease/ATP-binding subunit 2 [hydrothermal vent metagenome]|uniref:Heterodimeric efflux ABC transporter, permease/ATP-binding subunit 2 n=1 Tax=hydrothermal vent metagenome TaxID=652676 RepID=A0A3B0VT34_9ZZZZ
MLHNYGYFEEDKLGKLGDTALWGRILKQVRPQRRNIILAVILSLVVIAANLTLPWLVRLAIDKYIMAVHISAEARLRGLENIALIFIVMVIGGFAANFFQVTVLEYSGQHIMHGLRQRLLAHLLSLDVTFFNNNPVGKLVTRLTNDIQNLHEMFTSVITTIFNDILQLSAILIILFYMNRHLALLMCALLPLIIIHSLSFSRLARKAFRKIRTQLAIINSFMQESLTGISLIQHFLREADTEKQFRRQNRIFQHQTMYQIKIFGVFLPIIEIISTLSIALIVWIGGREVIKGTTTIGELAAFLSYMRLFFKPIREVAQKYSIVQSAMASAERIFELLDRQSAISTAGNLRLPNLRGAIRFAGVSLAYKQDEPIISDFNLNIVPGEQLAIVGPTGAGKTSIVNLLERLYEPRKGEIFIDDHPLADFNLAWLRGRIGLVMQDVLLMPASLRDNLIFGSSADEERLRAVVRDSQLELVVRELPQGLDTMVGEGGWQLSQGQKQLLALGRVMLRDPRILILDEATANIDSITEALLEKAVSHTIRNRTSIVIAHRLSTIRNAQRIVVLSRGRIREEGSYDELLERGGLFARLIELQEAREQSRPDPARNTALSV